MTLGYIADMASDNGSGANRTLRGKMQRNKLTESRVLSASKMLERELCTRTIFRAVTLTDGAVLEAGDLEIVGALPESRSQVKLLLEEPESWEQAIADFEKELLGQLFPRYPSCRKLAARLRSSHAMIANKLRKYGLPEKADAVRRGLANR